MFKNTFAPHSNPYDVLFEVEEPARLLSRNTNPSFQPAMKPLINYLSTMDAREAALGELEPQDPATESVILPKTTSQ